MLRITFKTNYQTRWGERVVVTGNIPELGSGNLNNALALEYQEGADWTNSIAVQTTEFEYQYVVVDDNFREINREWGSFRTFSNNDKKVKSVALNDNWRGKYHPENALYNAAFLKVIFNPKSYKSPKAKKKKYQSAVRFQIEAPRVGQNQRLCVLGNTPALGSWDASKPLLLGNENYPLWSGYISAVAGMNLEYKYGIYDTKEKEIIFLEDGENRVVPALDRKGKELTVIQDNYFEHPDGDWKGTGVAIPVFSLRSKQGLGIGEFTDIKMLVDWAANVGMKMVQILPINDTSATATWVDSYPYAAISVFALHPMFLNIASINGFEKIINQTEYKALQTKLNALENVDYEAVNEYKLKFARQIFDATKDKFLKYKAFQKFFESSQDWLKPYAYFCTLRDKYRTADFNQWEENSTFSNEKMEAACAKDSEQFDEIAFYYFLQYYLDKQLQSVSNYARKNNIILKGDIPIGIYRYSVDAWTLPHLYHMDAQAGAPPDPFSATGQNWGFPTYNWEEMAKDGYAWWQNRLRTLSKYFDAFRIDHILGFFRIWQVPYESIHATMGYFYPAIPVTIHELYQRDIGFDYSRFCMPYITHEHVEELFGHQADYVKHVFLEPTFDNRLAFKEQFNTQRKVENYFNQPNNQEKIHLKLRLFELHSEILFIEDKKRNGHFHPRFDLFKTNSYKYFPQHIQDRIYAVYLDYFYNRQEEFWAKSAMTKLPAIKAATDMLICGEDLGMIPDCVPQVMKDMDLLTLEIQRMSKNPETEFLQSEDTPYYSVSSPSTHDMSPVRLWWQESEKNYRQRFYQGELDRYGVAPAACSTDIVQQIVQQHLDLPSMWIVFPVSDLLGMNESLKHPNVFAERINEPSNPQHYWRYRMHLSMEDLIKNEGFTEQLSDMIEDAGR